MKKIKVIVNGLPGKMASAIVSAIISSLDMELIPYSLTGPEVENKNIIIDDIFIKLCGPSEKEFILIEGLPDIIIDFTHPDAIKENVDFYTKNNLNFVLGTTGGDLEYISEKIKFSNINAVVAPNMAKEIVAFQAMIEFAGSNFPDAFKGYKMKVKESHQKTKADTSGTAKAVIKSFNKLGVIYSNNLIKKIRNRIVQLLKGIPWKYLKGHGWHTYTLKKDDGTVFIQFTHNVNGREIYASGTLDAVRFLYRKRNGSRGIVYNMTDVLENL